MAIVFGSPLSRLFGCFGAACFVMRKVVAKRGLPEPGHKFILPEMRCRAGEAPAEPASNMCAWLRNGFTEAFHVVFRETVGVSQFDSAQFSPTRRVLHCNARFQQRRLCRKDDSIDFVSEWISHRLSNRGRRLERPNPRDSHEVFGETALVFGNGHFALRGSKQSFCWLRQRIHGHCEC